MKPLRLRLRAFGPYPRESLIDFSPLANGGLFLIHGPTGAGKTSILDGLCFALFGSASGGERSSEALRSDRAATDLLTEARLEFALGPDVYRITREPKQETAKKRGEGLKTSNPKGVLEKLTAGSVADLDGATWDLIASGDTKTNDAVVGLLGMNEDQFRQVVVLPQGQFRKFLSAGSTDREELLEQLFRTHRYRELCETMEKRKNALKKDITERQTKATALLSSLDVATAGDLDRLVLEAQERLALLERSGPEIESRHAVATEKLALARSFAKAKQELAAAEAKRKTLELERAEIEGARRKLADERRVRPVMEADRRVTEIQADLDKIGHEAEAAEKARVKAVAEAARARELLIAHEAKVPEAKTWESEKQKLQALLPKVTRLGVLRTQLGAVTKELARAESEAGDVERNLKSAKDTQPELQKKIDSLQETISKGADSAEELSQLTREKESAAALYTRLTELEKKRDAESHAKNESEKIEKEWASSQKVVTTLKLAYHRAQAALLAAQLEDQAPCPVCGSKDHPRPAKPTGDVPTPEALELAENDFASKTEKRAHWKSRSETSRQEIEAITEEVSKHVSGASETWKSQIVAKGTGLKARIDGLEALRVASREAKLALDKARTERDRLEDGITSLEAKVRASHMIRDEARAKARDLQVQLTELERDVPADQGDARALELKCKTLETRIEAFRGEEIRAREDGERASQAGARATERSKTLSEQIVKRTADLEKAAQQLAGELAKAGFASIDSARIAALTDAEVARLDERVRTHEAEWARTDGQVQKLEKELATAPEDARDLSGAQAAFVEVDKLRMDQKAERLSLADRIRQLETARERTRASTSEIAQLEARYGLIGRLADISLGFSPNELRINFQRYVLASRLDEVLEQASRRLHTMSRGQFTLRRARKTDDKRRSAGLDLEVEDSYTGTSRGTASLSGGEGFLASLSLALGLADVVQMHLGGVRLEAVFVDEGFGTLDPEALELAMRVLADLQAGGRMVGVISHVPELRDQIARRLAVRKTVDGSEIAWETGSI